VLHKALVNPTDKGKVTLETSSQTPEEEAAQETKNSRVRTLSTFAASRAGRMLGARCAYIIWIMARLNWRIVTYDRLTEIAIFA
jgi:hypothetical protein